MRAAAVILVLSMVILGAIPPQPPAFTPSPGVASAMQQFKEMAPVFASNCASLATAIRALTPNDKVRLQTARTRLAACRQSYKSIEAFLEYFFRSSSRIYNPPPKFEGEEPDMEYQSPIGLQVIEQTLFDKITPAAKQELLQQVSAIAASAADLPALLYDFKASDAQLLEALRLELIRIITLGITGYDAPLLKTGITESYTALAALQTQLQPYTTPSDSITQYLENSLHYLHSHPDFDSFDRVAFLKNNMLPLQKQLSRLIAHQHLGLHTTGLLNYNAAHLFSPDALDPVGNTAPDLITTGQALFFDETLSRGHNRSCATCHDPSKAFTDGLRTPTALDGHTLLPRNTPSLLYSAFQYRQFWDGRALTLEAQVRNVLFDHREMDADSITLTALKTDSVAKAISAFIRSLHPLNSPFDRYLNGSSDTLNAAAIAGANLFMGKAQCATCHFAPLFNGLIPPYYQLTEFEVLGTTSSSNLDHPALSKDQGRYTVYPFEFYRSAFKTPTVRNTALTAPYMHNGSLSSLEKVLDFYNRGGGAGLGLRIPSQTLPSTPLHLTKNEIRDIISFLNSLTDTAAR